MSLWRKSHKKYWVPGYISLYRELLHDTRWFISSTEVVYLDRHSDHGDWLMYSSLVFLRVEKLCCR